MGLDAGVGMRRNNHERKQGLRMFESNLCDGCGAILAESIYKLEYYILPAKLARKKEHQGKDWVARYCPDCHDSWQRVPYLVDQVECNLPKVQRGKVDDMACPICLSSIAEILPGLHGVVTITHEVDLSMIENWPLAIICGECVQSREIKLLKHQA